MMGIKVETLEEIKNLAEVSLYQQITYKDFIYQRIQIIDEPVIAFFNDTENHLIRIFNDGRINIMYCFLDMLQPGVYSYRNDHRKIH
ncbi:hypothetical protein [Solibacillus sp. NPDC093137]|uniref:hypothetical protein n=1 Tax=Solibacillus sp. NPDC093137 TaxID=3390678 RepID=UPI003D01C36D